MKIILTSYIRATIYLVLFSTKFQWIVFGQFLHKKCKIDWHCQFYRKYMTFRKGACWKKYKFVVFFDSDCCTLPPIAMTIPTHSMMQMTPSMICSGNILGPRMLIPIWELTRKNNFFLFRLGIFWPVCHIFPIKLTMSFEFAFFMKKWQNTFP